MRKPPVPTASANRGKLPIVQKPLVGVVSRKRSGLPPGRISNPAARCLHVRPPHHSRFRHQCRRTVDQVPQPASLRLHDMHCLIYPYYRFSATALAATP